MRHLLTILFISTAATAVTHQVRAQTPALPQSVDEVDDEFEDDESEDIVITASGRPRDSAVGDIEPEVVLDARDIRAYGASNVAELLTELAPLTGSIQGRGEGAPVVLLNGRRISGFGEVRDLPPEAIARVDVLPEEVALKYGYPPTQKVVNIVLRRRFQAITAELEGRVATRGGRLGGEADINYLRIDGGGRLSLDVEVEHDDALFETDRDLVDADPGRTLLAATDRAKINGSYNRTILGNVSATATGEYEATDSRSGLGLAQDLSILERDRRQRAATLGLAFNGDAADWRWSLTGNYARGETVTLTDRERAGGVERDRARSVTDTLNAEAVANGEPFRLPAGPASTSVTVGTVLRDIDSETQIAGVTTATRLGRDEVRSQLDLDLPIASRRAGVLSGLGLLSLNANATLEHLSDFGTLATYGYGFNWEPIGPIRLIGSVRHEEGAPGIEQLGAPLIVTPNVQLIDVSRGETVDVTLTEGGNPALLSDSRRVLKLGLTARPLDGLTTLATYTDSRTERPSASLPAVTPAIEAAFPERFVRDASGRLISVDSRPVNFDRSRQRQLRWGLNLSTALGTAPEPTPEQREALAAAREARREARGAGEGGRGGRGGGGRGFGGGGGGFRGGQQGRLQLSLFHNWRFEDSILIRDGLPELDLLAGDAVGRGGGQPRHQVDARLGYTRAGLGARLNVDWRGASLLNADPDGLPSLNDLRFGPRTTVGLRLFADLGQQRSLVQSVPFFRRSRVTLAFNNLFDERPDVRDAAGLVPTGYQPDRLDPLGRSVRLQFRKLF